MSCNVIPDKGLFEPGYVQPTAHQTLRQTTCMLGARDHSGDKNYINKKYHLFHSCRQGIDVNKQYPALSSIMGKEHRKGLYRVFEDYPDVMIKYINLDDVIMYWLHLKSKPRHIKLKELQ